MIQQIKSGFLLCVLLVATATTSYAIGAGGGGMGAIGGMTLGVNTIGASGAAGLSLAGVSIDVNDMNGNVVYTAVTDANGLFEIPREDLPNGVYTFTPTKERFDFSPTSIVAEIMNNATLDLDFTAMPIAYFQGNISDNMGVNLFGVKVQLSDSGIAVSPSTGVTVTIGDGITVKVGDSDGDGISVSTTDANGNFAFYDLPTASRSYTVTPSHEGWTINLQNIDTTTDPVIINFQSIPVLGEIQRRIMPGDYVISSQADIAGLAGYTEIERVLNIYNANLENLSGLEGLEKVAALWVRDNSVLTNLEGLNNLSDASLGVEVNNNSALTSLNGLNNLGPSVLGIRIIDNPNLTDIGALENITTIWLVLAISNNDALTNLSGLQNLSNIGPHIWGKGKLEITSNDSLTDISALNGLTSIEDILIFNNAQLRDFNGLHNWEHIGHFRIQNSIIGFQGLSNLTTVDNLDIIDSEVYNFEGLDSLTSIYTFKIPRSLRSFQGLSSLTSIGTLTINLNPYLHDFNGLEGVIDINDLSISNCDGLTSLNGLGNLSTCNNILVENNDSLVNLGGLGNQLIAVNFLTIQNNDSMLNLNGLNFLTSSVEMKIANNANLETLEGLDNLTIVSIYGATFPVGRLYITGNPSLVHLDNLSSLSMVRGGLYVFGNTACCEQYAWDLVAQVQSLNEIYSITIENNKVCN